MKNVDILMLRFKFIGFFMRINIEKYDCLVKNNNVNNNLKIS